MVLDTVVLVMFECYLVAMVILMFDILYGFDLKFKWLVVYIVFGVGVYDDGLYGIVLYVVRVKWFTLCVIAAIAVQLFKVLSGLYHSFSRVSTPSFY
jgi:hypothetical protein